MNKKENHSVKSEIEQALLRLMTQKSYLDITVTDIVQEAKVARVSFYRNFASISEVLDSIADATAEKLNIEFLPLLDTTDELEKEKKKKSFVFDQVMKAATLLTNAVSNLDDAMSKDGVGKQLDNIEGACAALRDWIK